MPSPVTLVLLAVLGLGLGCASAPAARAADPLPLYKAGIAKKKAGDLEGAEASFRACLDADPKYGRCHFSLGVLIKKKGDLAGAEGHFRQALAAYPTWGQAHLALGMTLVKKGDPDGGKAELDAAVADKDLEADDRAEAWNAIGVVHRQASRWPDAVAAYDQAIAAKPGAANFYQNKAIALEHLDQAAAMEAAARKALELGLDDGTTWLLIGRALMYQKKADAAVPALQTATSKAPKDPIPWYALGEAAEAAGQKAEAKRAFGMYVELAPAEVDRAPVRARIERLGR
ncbi:MAG: tetratricopeptide repeat protein [Myxococcota bacterium]